MHLKSAIIIYGGGPGSGCNPKAGKCGRPSTGTKDESEGFFSPNMDEGLKFEDALQRLNSPQQQQAISRAQFLINKTFGNGTVENAIGDWKDGAENSAVVHVPANDKQALDFVMATLGKELQQKSVISFAHDDNGPDRLYTIHTSNDIGSTRKILEQAGIEHRTLVPEAGGTTVHIFDQGRKMFDKIAPLSQKLQSDSVTIRAGQGEFLGGDTREAGQQKYDSVIGRYKEAAGVRPQRSQRKPVRAASWYSRIQKAERC